MAIFSPPRLSQQQANLPASKKGPDDWKTERSARSEPTPRNSCAYQTDENGAQRSRPFALIALKLVGHPKQRTKDGGAVVADQVHDTGFYDEAAEFDEVPRALAALDLPWRMSCRALAA